MKKIFSLLVIVCSFGFVFTSCNNDDDPVYVGDGNDDTIAEVFEIKDSFGYDTSLGWVIKGVLNPKIYTSDNLLIYRLSGTNASGKDVWQQIPRTLYLDLDGDGFADDELEYDFDFSIEDFIIYADGTYNLALTPDLINNQTFRIVIVPGSFGASKLTAPVDYNDYNAVIKHYNIDDSNVKVIKP